jgi:hypothetical protein
VVSDAFIARFTRLRTECEIESSKGFSFGTDSQSLLLKTAKGSLARAYQVTNEEMTCEVNLNLEVQEISFPLHRQGL